MRLKNISALSLAAAMSVCTVPAFGAAETENVNVPKYIFLFIGDGMSYPQVQTTNYYLNAIATCGGTGAIALAFATYLEKNEGVMLPNIMWPAYLQIATNLEINHQVYN